MDRGIDVRTEVCEHEDMKGSEFLRKTKRYAGRKELNYRVGAVTGRRQPWHLGEHMTVVKDLKKELGKGLFRSMCRDLEIDPREL